MEQYPRAPLYRYEIVILPKVNHISLPTGQPYKSLEETPSLQEILLRSIPLSFAYHHTLLSSLIPTKSTLQ